MKIELNNETLTAYALGELAAEERMAVQAALATDERARKALKEIRAAIDLAHEVFADGAAVELTADQREEIEQLAEKTEVIGAGDGSTESRGRARVLVGFVGVAAALAIVTTLVLPGLLRQESMQVARFEIGDLRTYDLIETSGRIEPVDLNADEMADLESELVGLGYSGGEDEKIRVVVDHWSGEAAPSVATGTKGADTESAQLRAEELKNERVDELNTQADVFLEFGMNDQAVEYYNQVLMIEPDNKAARQGQHKAVLEAYKDGVEWIKKKVDEQNDLTRAYIESKKVLGEGMGPDGLKPYRLQGLRIEEIPESSSVTTYQATGFPGGEVRGQDGGGSGVASQGVRTFAFDIFGNGTPSDIPPGVRPVGGNIAPAPKPQPALKQEAQVIELGRQVEQLQSLGYLGGGVEGNAAPPRAETRTGFTWFVDGSDEITVAHRNGEVVLGTPFRTTGGIAGRPGRRGGRGRPGYRYQVADVPDPRPLVRQESPGSEDYDGVHENRFLRVTQHPLSTFSIDVDTAAYSNLRRFLNRNTLPPKDSVRIEEMINYFSYDYAPPEDKSVPFSAHMELAEAPWAPEHRLVKIGLKGWEMARDERPATNLVFLLDVSGSMSPENKLPLVKRSMKLLTRQLSEADSVAIVVYAGSSGLVLPATPGDRQDTILGALDRLKSGGSTNGGAGIRLAYNLAIENFIEGSVNRVILATDGDFNVGTTNQGELIELIQEKAKSGVFLSVFGFGMGNLKDATLESLADKGNGTYGYIDTYQEARKVFVDQLNSTLVTIAKDVKIQVEFNPAKVKAYRLIGYENRVMAARDFNDDTKDAGEIGAGHTVTALFEIVPTGVTYPARGVDPLKYRAPAAREVAPEPTGEFADELLTLKLRYKAPDGDTSTLIEFPLKDSAEQFRDVTTDFKFAASVASFGMLLRGSRYSGDATINSVLELAEDGMGRDTHGYRAEFIDLVRKAKGLYKPQRGHRETVTYVR